MIQQLANGRWKLTLNRPGGGGDRVRVCRTVDTEHEAKTLELYLSGRPAEADGVTVLGAVERYLVVHAARFDPQTESTYRGLRDRFIASTWIGAVRLDALTWQQLETFYAQLQTGTHKPHGRKLAASSVRPVKYLISGALADVLRLGWVMAHQYEPARIVIPKSETRKRKEPIRVADIARIVAAAPDDYREILQLAVASGARQGELAALRWCDIDLTTGMVTIAASVSKAREQDRTPGNPGWHRKATKTGDYRLVRVDAACVAMLEARYARQWQAAQLEGIETLDDRAVASSRLELELTAPAALGLLWDRLRKSLGIVKGVKFHHLRALSTSAMLGANVPILDVQRRGGWASAQMPLEVYGHALGTEADEAALAATASAWARLVQ